MLNSIDECKWEFRGETMNPELVDVVIALGMLNQIGSKALGVEIKVDF